MPLRTLLELDVELIGGPLAIDCDVRRRIRVDSTITMEELHYFIEKCFDREGDPHYEYMFGAPYEPDSLRISGCTDATCGEGTRGDAKFPPPEQSGEQPHLLTLNQLSLKEGQRFGYLSDFIQEWVHRVTVVRITAQAQSTPFESELIVAEGLAPVSTMPDALDLQESIDAGLEESDTALTFADPYYAEQSPDRNRWLALDELEALLLTVEAHAREIPTDHPPIRSVLLHGLVHSIAETRLALGDAEVVSRLDRLIASGLTRHQAIHRIGEQLVQSLLSERRVSGLSEQPTNAIGRTDNLQN